MQSFARWDWFVNLYTAPLTRALWQTSYKNLFLCIFHWPYCKRSEPYLFCLDALIKSCLFPVTFLLLLSRFIYFDFMPLSYLSTPSPISISVAISSFHSFFLSFLLSFFLDFFLSFFFFFLSILLSLFLLFLSLFLSLFLLRSGKLYGIFRCAVASL